MQRKGVIALAIGGALLGAASVAVLSGESPSAVPLAIEYTPPPTPTPVPTPTPEPTPAPVPTAVPQLINNGPRDRAQVALTFDTSYDAVTAASVASGFMPRQFDPAVLDALATHGAPATVFVTGLWAQDHPDAMQRLVSSAPQLEIGNHSWSHNAWTADCYGLPYVGPPEQQRAEIEVAAAQISQFTGTAPTLFRFPGMCASPEGVVLAAELGEQPVGADVLFNDAFVTDPQAGVEAILSQVTAGSIIGLHLNGAPNAPATAAMVDALVPALRERGLELVTVSTLLAPTAAAPTATDATAADAPPTEAQ